MARELGLGSSTVDNWKRERRIPSQHQPAVLQKGSELGLELTAEDVIWPFPEDREAQL